MQDKKKQDKKVLSSLFRYLYNHTVIYIVTMGVTTLQVNLNSQRMIDLHLVKKKRGIPDKQDAAGYLSDDMFARILLLERLEELMKTSKKE